ncbi:MAG: GIY-YIG nuclease family protein [Chloroflexi bacterium]|nr:GIY-YIG nuclease family protein [Chloroflexota bacterium]
MAQYYVYIMTNATRTLYIGVTNDLLKRVYEHKGKLTGGFTKKYNVTWLAYYEVTTDVYTALTREKQLKKWSRGKKVALIQSMNPRWKDLAQDWHDEQW